MATAKQLPSGSWFIRIWDGNLKKQVCFTSKLPGKAGKNEVELMAREYLTGKKEKQLSGRTVGECIDEYIALKENILSPTTISEYKRCKAAELSPVCDKSITAITSQDIQALINKLSITLKPKTVRNAHGLLVAVLNVYAPDLRVRTTLPKVQKKIKELPDVQTILNIIVGSNIELPCLLALWCGLRMSEIRGAKISDIKNGVLTIHNTKVRVNNIDVEKDKTKTFESTRQIMLPERLQCLINDLPEGQQYLTTLTGQALYMRFSRLLQRNNITHISFHDLRHLNASIMLALGIPDKYAMERGGWSSPSVLKSVYQHTFTAERKKADRKVDEFFTALLDTNLVTKTE